jgi:hypothetical protein
MTILGIEKADVEDLEYPYFLIKNDKVIKSFQKLGTALIELAAEIDEKIGIG